MKQSVSRGGKNLVLLQKEEENTAEESNADADINAEANTIRDEKKDMVVTMKEENNNLKDIETMNVDIENIASKNNHFGDQYMKLLMIHILM